jgi:hypothetical protein
MPEVNAGVDKRFNQFCVGLSHGDQFRFQRSDLRLESGQSPARTVDRVSIGNPKTEPKSFRAARAKAAAKSRTSPWGLGSDATECHS